MVCLLGYIIVEAEEDVPQMETTQNQERAKNE
jgi:hypothetical protein